MLLSIQRLLVTTGSFLQEKARICYAPSKGTERRSTLVGVVPSTKPDELQWPLAEGARRQKIATLGIQGCKFHGNRIERWSLCERYLYVNRC
jgi:hypothetical protein